jgi:hypothetical protein
MHSSSHAAAMLKRIVLCAFLLCTAFPASASDYTDIWYVPAESGWGVNVVQSDSFLFVTFFIYGADNKPTWYTAQLTLDASGNYNGPLYATTGTYYAMPWNPKDNPPATQVGTASFQPTSPYTAKLVYTLTTGPVTVNKAVQRQSLTQITIGGSYVGAQSGAYSGCSNSSSNQTYSDFFSLDVNQSTSGSVTLTFTYQGLTCTLSGTLTQFGQLYTIPTTAYKCSDGLNTNAKIDELRATALGIEGRFSSPTVGGGCREDATFSGVLH